MNTVTHPSNYPLPDNLTLPVSVHFIHHKFPIRIYWQPMYSGPRAFQRGSVVKMVQPRGWHASVRIPELLVNHLSRWAVDTMEAMSDGLMTTCPVGPDLSNYRHIHWAVKRVLITMYPNGECTCDVYWELKTQSYRMVKFTAQRPGLKKAKPKKIPHEAPVAG